MIRALLLPALLLLAAPAACGQPAPSAAENEPDFPALTGRVVDAAGLLPPDAEQRLAAASAAVEHDVGAQFVIVTVPDLQGRAIEDYGYKLGRHWGIGHKGRNDGLLLIVAPNERKVRIEVGYGLEKRVTDAFAGKVIRDDALPRFRRSDFTGGIEATSDDLLRRLRSKASDREIAAEDRMVT